MKQLEFLWKISLATVCLLGTACSNEDIDVLKEPDGSEKTEMHTIPLNFIGGIVDFSDADVADAPQTRAITTATWEEGDKLYLSFYTDDSDLSKKVSGDAVYHSSTEEWLVNCNEALVSGEYLKCEVRFFSNVESVTSSIVSLSAYSEIYAALDASYTYDNGTLTVQAILTPKTGRIRFTGTVGDSLYIRGISVYKAFTPGDNKFFTSDGIIHTGVERTGSTPYIYGYFSEEDRRLSVINENSAYTRICKADMLSAGESGYMAIPSETVHNNWRSGMDFMLDSVEFKMILVSGYEKGFFLIGETEVTEALYNSVNGERSKSQLPITISSEEALQFVRTINNKTSLDFALPTESQWTYAAKGGNLSQGERYSGSNDIDEVAWYSGNAQEKQNVKTKIPNALGIYDMSGNVSEYALSEDSYNSGYYYCFGGDYTSSADECTVTSKSYNTYTSYTGFRLVLNID